MMERDDFLQALAANEDDTSLRLVFADWLDDNGEHEEADRQRKWPAAKEWFVRFCRENNPQPGDDTDTRPISPERLIEMGTWAVSSIFERNKAHLTDEAMFNMLQMGWNALEQTRLIPRAEQWEFDFGFGNNETMMYAFWPVIGEYWKNWSIVTGVPLPPGAVEKTRTHCGC